MGEMADYAIDTIIDNMIRDQDDYDPDEIEHIVFTSGVQCKFCKRWPYYWKQLDNGQWRLYTKSGKVHKCSKYMLAREKEGDVK